MTSFPLFTGAAQQKPLFVSNFPYFVEVPPAALPIELPEVKRWLRLDPNDATQDAELTLIMQAATTCCEEITRRVLITTTFITMRNSFSLAIELLRSPFQSLVSFKYTVDGSLVDVDNTLYYTTREKDYSGIILNADSCYPTDGDNRLQGMQIQFVAGYGDASTDIPPPLLIGIRNHIAAMYESRGDCECDSSSAESSLPAASRDAYNKFRILGLV
jgi:uncharacterized phiE125 gp8 family phage protein